MLSRTLLAAALAAAVLGSGLGAARPAAAADAPGPWVTVEGNRLTDASGAPLQLVGLNRSGSEYACAQGWGVFDGPVDDAAVALMQSWRINAVRVPLNEHCWLGRNGVDSSFAGERYRSAVRGFVHRLNAAGLVAVLELHWSAAGDTLALGTAPMPNTDHSVAFWSSVATGFRDTPGVVFELFNEPHSVSWACWRDGCGMPGGWRAAGMQQLLDTVRAAGARQAVIATGLRWGNDLTGWLEHRPDDPASALAAGFHVYDFNACITPECWESTVGRVAARFPVVATEVGQGDCGYDFAVAYLRWADARGISFMPWTWNDWAGCSGPALLTDYDGTPSRYGAGIRAYLHGRTAPLTAPAAAGVAPTRRNSACGPAQGGTPPLISKGSPHRSSLIRTALTGIHHMYYALPGRHEVGDDIWPRSLDVGHRRLVSACALRASLRQ